MRVGLGPGVARGRMTGRVAPADDVTPTNITPPAFNSVKARNPVVGDVVAAADITGGTWTDSPTSTTKGVLVGASAKTLPYTYVSGDIGQTVKPTEFATKGALVSATAQGVVTQPVLVAPPAGTQYLSHITDITTPRWDGSGASKIRIPSVAKTFYWDAAYHSWQLSTEDNIWYRFETRPGDVMDNHPFPDSVGTERNRLVEDSPDWHTTQDFRWRGSFIIDSGFDLGSFNTFLESHTYGTGGSSPGAKQFETAISVANKLWLLANYSPTSGNPVERSMWNSTGDFVPGYEYAYDIFFRRDPTGNGRLRVVLDNVEVLNFAGQTGHHVMSNYANQFGHYRGGSPGDTGIIRHKIVEMSFAPFGTMTDPNPVIPPIEVLGPNLVTGTFTAKDSGTFVTDTNTLYWKATSGAATGPSNIPGGGQTYTGLTAGAKVRVQGTYRRGTAGTNAKVVAFTNDGAFTQLGIATTTSTTDVTFSFDIIVPSNGQFMVYWGMQATASAQTAFFLKSSLMVTTVNNESLGPELAGSRQPFTNTTGLTIGAVGTNGSVTWNSPNAGYVNFLNNIVSGNVHAKFTVTTEVGKTYKVVFTARNFSSDGFYLSVFGTSMSKASDPLFGSPGVDQTITMYFHADSTTTTIFMHTETYTTAKYLGLKSISVKKAF